LVKQLQEHQVTLILLVQEVNIQVLPVHLNLMLEELLNQEVAQEEVAQEVLAVMRDHLKVLVVLVVLVGQVQSIVPYMVVAVVVLVGKLVLVREQALQVQAVVVLVVLEQQMLEQTQMPIKVAVAAVVLVIVEYKEQLLLEVMADQESWS
jgi:hypothetical protein